MKQTLRFFIVILAVFLGIAFSMDPTAQAAQSGPERRVAKETGKKSGKSSKKQKSKTKPESHKTVDDLLQEDDADLLTPASGAAKQTETAPTAPAPKVAPQPEPAAPSNEEAQGIRAVLLDVAPSGSLEALAQTSYNTALNTLRTTKDLAVVMDRSSLGKGPLYNHIVKTCRGLDNTRCLKGFANSLHAQYAFYGELRELDDVYLFVFETLDASNGRVMNSIRTQLPKVEKGLDLQVSRAVCQIAKPFGCDLENLVNDVPVAALVPTPAATAAPAPAVTAPAPSAKPAPSTVSAAPKASQSPKAGESDDADTMAAGEEKRPKPEPAPATVEETKPAPKASDETMFADESQNKANLRQASGKTLSPMAMAGWSLFAIGAAAALGGIYPTIMAFQAYDDYKNAAPEKKKDHEDTIKTMNWTYASLYIGGGAMAATGIILLITDALSPSSSSQTAFHLAPGFGPEGAGFVAEGRF